MSKDLQFPGFASCMRMMRKRNAQTQEDGFHLLRPRATEFIEELIAEFQAETQDHGLRCWLLELISAARDTRALPLLAELLTSSDKSFHEHALAGLQLLDTPESRRVFFEAAPPAPRTSE